MFICHLHSHVEVCIVFSVRLSGNFKIESARTKCVESRRTYLPLGVFSYIKRTRIPRAARTERETTEIWVTLPWTTRLHNGYRNSVPQASKNWRAYNAY